MYNSHYGNSQSTIMLITKKGVNMSIPQNLIDAWKVAKQEEKNYQELRWQIEEQIYEKVEEQIKETGTYNFNDLQIIITENKEWDSDVLNDIYEQFPNKDLWPFKPEWKPLSAVYKTLQEKDAVAAAILNPALTIKRKSPTFKIKEVK